MECPFELPVTKVMKRPYANPYIVKGDGKEICMCQDELEADYIIQAINSHEKLVDLLIIAKCSNPICQDGAIPHQVGEQEWEAEQCQWCDEKKQTLKEAEKE